MTTALKILDYPVQNSINNLKVCDFKKVEEVLKALLDRDYSENTRLAIFRDIKHFIEWYSNINQAPFSFEEVTERDVRDYRDQSQKKELSSATINRRLSTLKQFFDFAIEMKHMDRNPSDRIKKLQRQALAPKGLTQSEARKLLKEVEVRGNMRDRCLIELMLGAGCRVSDLIGLKVNDVQISERKGHLIIRQGKGNKSRKVPLNKELRRLLSELTKDRNSKDHLFTGQRGVLGNIAINKIVEKYSVKAGFKASPHSLRHTFAYNFLKEHPSDIVALAQLLGHSNINTTAIYCQNRLEDLQEKVEAVMV